MHFHTGVKKSIHQNDTLNHNYKEKAFFLQLQLLKKYIQQKQKNGVMC